MTTNNSDSPVGNSNSGFKNKSIYPSLKDNLEKLMANGFSEITDSRKKELQDLAIIIREQKNNKENVRLNFICTHNSRRSHISQLLAYASTHYLLEPEVAGKFSLFSGGTEATAFHPNSIKALREFGFHIEPANKDSIQAFPFPNSSSNPIYEVRISDSIIGLYAFSKKYGDPPNPNKDYIAVMTCDHAAENCPVVFGADKKFNLTYKDPKASDGTPDQDRIYRERVEEIGREMLYLSRQGLKDFSTSLE
ncbi:MAG: protein-tyrosine-phosphatase [Leptospira sp.]|nr:protein-tyrosine-phosphatase [Leptospira sp.]